MGIWNHNTSNHENFKVYPPKCYHSLQELRPSQGIINHHPFFQTLISWTNVAGEVGPYRFLWSNVSNVVLGTPWTLPCQPAALPPPHSSTRPSTNWTTWLQAFPKKGVGKEELKWINRQTPHRIHGNGIFANIYLTKSAKCRKICHTLILWASKRTVSWLRVFSFV